MRISLEALLSKTSILLADGATGTNFMEMGLEPGFPPDIWNVTEPNKPEALHQMFVDAGADIILTNTFGANAPRLKLHDAQDETYAINKAGAQIAGDVAKRAKRHVVVGGSVGPTGELFEPMGEMTMESAKAAFHEQIRGLKDGGADVIWIETMSAAEEITAACEAAIELDIPFVFTASFDTAGKTMMGIAPSEIGQVATALKVPPLAYGANCGVGASDMLLTNLEMTQADPDAVIVSKSNCGIPVVKGKETVYTGTPELMGEFLRMAADSGVRIIGGCCGNAPEHIAAMRAALDAYEPSVRPTLDDITTNIGPLISPPTTKAAKDRLADRNKRRRRR
ncbi:MAG: betaine--homocysteine S-methyltransferase [Litorimonas sp.]